MRRRSRSLAFRERFLLGALGCFLDRLGAQVNACADGGVHPATELGRRFRDDLGRLNAAVSEVADEVLLVVAGRILPLELLE